MDNQRGFSLVETLIATSIAVIVCAISGMAMYQILTGTQTNNKQLEVLHQVQNAEYWIARDAQMAISINATEDLTFPKFLQFGWTEWDDEGDPVYNLTEYSLEEGEGNIYKLHREHTTSNGMDEESIVAKYIYYDPGEAFTSNNTYTDPVLIVSLSALCDDCRATREFRIKRRPGV